MGFSDTFCHLGNGVCGPYGIREMGNGIWARPLCHRGVGIMWDLGFLIWDLWFAGSGVEDVGKVGNADSVPKYPIRYTK